MVWISSNLMNIPLKTIGLKKRVNIPFSPNHPMCFFWYCILSGGENYTRFICVREFKHPNISIYHFPFYYHSKRRIVIIKKCKFMRCACIIVSWLWRWLLSSRLKVNNSISQTAFFNSVVLLCNIFVKDLKVAS